MADARVGFPGGRSGETRRPEADEDLGSGDWETVEARPEPRAPESLRDWGVLGR
jgi:hypothetical protein